MSRKQEGTENGEKVYSYFVCRGKYETDANGELRHICTGHTFTAMTKLNECPVCGKPLIILQTKMPRTDAITLAMEKCFKCEHMEKSRAVNELFCVGGESKIKKEKKKIRGTEACNACPCAECCKELIDDFSIAERYGWNNTFAALNKISFFVKWALQRGVIDSEYEKRMDELRGSDQVLKSIPYEVYSRWVCDALDKAEKIKKRGGI